MFIGWPNIRKTPIPNAVSSYIGSSDAPTACHEEYKLDGVPPANCEVFPVILVSELSLPAFSDLRSFPAFHACTSLIIQASTCLPKTMVLNLTINDIVVLCWSARKAKPNPARVCTFLLETRSGKHKRPYNIRGFNRELRLRDCSASRHHSVPCCHAIY